MTAQAHLHPTEDSVAFDEDDRLRALAELRVMDTPAEPVFDDLVWLASLVCDAPIALVSLVDDTRQWFKASRGLSVRETPRCFAFCAHALASADLLEVPDTLNDTRFADNPLVVEAPGIRFYAGAPLIGRSGLPYGTLCIIDTVPRMLDERQREALSCLARQVVSQLEARSDRKEAQTQAHTLSRLLETMPDAVVSCDADGLLGQFNGAARAWHGTDPRSLPSEQWAEHFDLFQADGENLLPTEQIPLLCAWRGESVRGVEMVVKAKGQPPRTVVCNAQPLATTDGACLGAVAVMHDVTELRAATRAAEIAAQRFAGAFAAATHGMALVSLAGQWMEVNDALCAMLGYPREELLRTTFQQLTHPEDIGYDMDEVNRLLEGRMLNYQMNKRYFRKDGQTVWARLAVSLVRDLDGEPVHFVSQIQDVTEQHRIEARLRDSESRMRSILENTYDAFVASDDEGRILEWNSAAEATFGWRRSEVLGKLMSLVLVPPDSRAAHDSGMGWLKRTGMPRLLDRRLQLQAWHRNGYAFPVEITISQVQLGSVTLFTAFMHDITDRLAAEETLRKREAELHTIADNVPALVAHVAADLTYLFVNKAYGDWFQMDPGQIIGKRMQAVMPAQHFAGVELYLNEVRHGTPVDFEMEVVDAGGISRVMHATYVPDAVMPDADGRPATVGFHLMVTDITVHKQLARVMEERALRDDLTGLHNRPAWNEHLQRVILQRGRRGDQRAAVMFVDLDGFKTVNDRFGHDAGDALLRYFASLLKSSLREQDFIARLGGDEFVVWLHLVDGDQADVRAIASKILDACQRDFVVAGHRLLVRPSIGIAVQCGSALDVKALTKRADEAMYVAKQHNGEHLEIVEITA